MKKQLLELTIEEFTRVLLDYPEEIHLIVKTYNEEGEKSRDDEITGTYEEISDLMDEYPLNHPYREAIEKKLSTEFDYRIRINDLDIYNYLDHLTNQFQQERMRLIYNEMECFYIMIYCENIDAEVMEKYAELDWEIPTKEVTYPNISNREEMESHIMADLGAMRESIHPCREFAYMKAISLLKRKIQPLGYIAPSINDIRSSDKQENRTMKVTTDVLMKLLDKAGVNENNSDKTKMAKLIGYITGFSENTIRQRITNQEELTSNHKDEVEKINKTLSELNIEISIKYNNKR